MFTTSGVKLNTKDKKNQEENEFQEPDSDIGERTMRITLQRYTNRKKAGSGVLNQKSWNT